MRTYRVRRALATDRDLALLADFLFESYRAFGDGVADASSRVERRIEAVEDMMATLAEHPHRGSPRPDLLAGVRSLTADRVVLYFEVDDEASEVRVLGVFFGGQDHHRRMLIRLGEQDRS